MDLSPQGLCRLLKQHSFGKDIKEVLSVSRAPAVGKGENYVSYMTRLTVEVQLASGEVTTKSFVLKELPEGEWLQSWIHDTGLFKTEILVYCNIFPKLTKLVEQFNLKDYISWPAYVGHHPYDQLLIEDLKTSNYTTATRQKGLDLQHAQLSVRKMAKFHALTHFLHSQNGFDPKDYTYHFLLEEGHSLRFYNHPAFKVVSDIVAEEWGPEWKEIGDKLRAVVPSMVPKLMELRKINKSAFNVLCHGDCWVNNMMFTYKDDVPVDFRFVDFQMAHYNSFAMDLHHLLNTALTLQVRKDHFNDLLKLYHTSLLAALKDLNYDPPTAPTFEQVVQELERTNFFGLVCAMSELPAFLCDTDYAMDFAELAKSQTIDNIVMNINMFRTEAFKDLLQFLLKYMVSKNVI